MRFLAKMKIVVGWRGLQDVDPHRLVFRQMVRSRSQPVVVPACRTTSGCGSDERNLVFLFARFSRPPEGVVNFGVLHVGWKLFSVLVLGRLSVEFGSSSLILKLKTNKELHHRDTEDTGYF